MTLLPGHEDVLRRLLTGELSEGDKAVQHAFDESPETEARWRELARTASELDTEARDRAEVLAEVSAATGDPHEDELVRGFAARLRARSPRAAPEPPPTGPVGRGWMVAAAALLVVGLALRFAGRDATPEPIEPFELGQSPSECRPSGAVERYGRFDWDLELPLGGTYELSVWDAEATSARLLLRVELTEASWEPGELPPRIEWQVDVLDAAGELTGESCSARCWLDSH